MSWGCYFKNQWKEVFPHSYLLTILIGKTHQIYMQSRWLLYCLVKLRDNSFSLLPTERNPYHDLNYLQFQKEAAIMMSVKTLHIVIFRIYISLAFYSWFFLNTSPKSQWKATLDLFWNWIRVKDEVITPQCPVELRPHAIKVSLTL